MKRDELIKCKASIWKERGFNNIPGSLLTRLAESNPNMKMYAEETFEIQASPFFECACGEVHDTTVLFDKLIYSEEACSSCGRQGNWSFKQPKTFPVNHPELWNPKYPDEKYFIEKEKFMIADLGFFIFKHQDIGLLLGYDGKADKLTETWEALYNHRFPAEIIQMCGVY